MKQTINKGSMITLGLFALCTLGIKNVTFAGTKNDDPVEVKFIGAINNLPTIQIDLNNSEEGEYSITIKDMKYHILYFEIVRGKDLSKTIKLNTDKNEINAPGFTAHVEVTSQKTLKTTVFNINNSSIAEDAVISKL